MSTSQYIPYPPLFLVGARACGKSTMGAYLARALSVALPQQHDWCFLDTDDLLLRALGESIADFVAREGWEAFRHREGMAVRAATAPLTVLATGGGCILDSANRDFMRQEGCVLYLHAPAAVLAERLRAEPLAAQRPSLTGADLCDEVAEVLHLREPLYRETAFQVVDASLPVADVLGALLQGYSLFLAKGAA